MVQVKTSAYFIGLTYLFFAVSPQATLAQEDYNSPYAEYSEQDYYQDYSYDNYSDTYQSPDDKSYELNYDYHNFSENRYDLRLGRNKNNDDSYFDLAAEEVASEDLAYRSKRSQDGLFNLFDISSNTITEFLYKPFNSLIIGFAIIFSFLVLVHNRKTQTSTSTKDRRPLSAKRASSRFRRRTKHFGTLQDYEHLMQREIKQFNVARCYRILQTSPRDSDDVIKQKYRYLAKQLHSDRLTPQNLPPERLIQAQEQFRSIQTAYEHIKKVRGFN